MNSPIHKIIIVGGGFGGISAVLALEKNKLPNVKIILISDKPHFEYHPALYRVVTGRSPLEVCIPLREIFKGKKIEVLEDSVAEINLKEKSLKGASGSRYSFDFLCLALGSETTYFNIPGLKDFSFGFKSITEALRLKQHFHQLFRARAEFPIPTPHRGRMHFVIVGGGASGVELAGELAAYAKKLSQKHGVSPSFIAIDLIEAAPRLLPSMPEDVSKIITNRLARLGVNVILNQTVTKQELEEIHLKTAQMQTKTVIWTAGVKPNKLYEEIVGLTLDKKRRVVVDEFLQAKGWNNIFVIGDAASTPYAGMAQTAIYDGNFIAEIMAKKIHNNPLSPYKPKAPTHSIPVGPGWSATLVGGLRFYGRLGWWLRRLADFKFFLSILPFRKALLAFQSEKTLCESCAICIPETFNKKVETI